MTTEDSENQQQQDAPPAAVKESGYFRFHDPEEMEVAMANAMPGGSIEYCRYQKSHFTEKSGQSIWDMVLPCAAQNS